ncbi:MAG: hypothetical protein J6N52_13155 [Clostridia bacterium]|nr:hypothetical protein [Clostridia bacterium]
MKKKITAAALIFLLAAGVTGYAALKSEGILTKPFEISEAELGSAIDTESNGFAEVYSRIQNTSENDEAAYLAFYSYIYTLNKNKASADESEYLNNMILSGFDISRITGIYDFVSDTKYDIELVQDIYNKASENDFVGSFWIEEAFNAVTENAHGVLDTDEIEEYIEKGLTINDVLAANELSRQGVYTINEILDECTSGTSFGTVAAKVYMQNAAVKTGSAARLKQKASSDDIIKSAELSAITGDTMDAFLVDSSLIEEASEEVKAGLAAKTISQLEAIGITDPDKSEKSINYDLISLALGNGITNDEIDKYLAEGYEDIDILNASEYVKALGCTMEEGFRELYKEGYLVGNCTDKYFAETEADGQ